MAVADNVVPNITSSIQNLETESNDIVNLKPKNDSEDLQSNDKDQNLQKNVDHSDKADNYKVQMQNGVKKNHRMMVNYGGGGYGINQMNNGEDGRESFNRDMRDLEELLSKLNPMAEEFVPLSLTNFHHGYFGDTAFGYAQTDIANTNNGHNNNINRRKKNVYSQGRRRMNYKMSAAKRDEMVRRTVYVSDIDQQVTEERLASVFTTCGPVVDCRICGDPNSILRFAFVEFLTVEGARAALNLSGTVLGFYPVRVLPSKTAIAPVNPELLPRSEDEREMCARTIYCTNIDKKITQAEVKLFFESLCGEVHRLRLLGDYHHFTRIAFVEFTMAESAIAALNCSGVVLGSLPIRVSPSKTPVLPRSTRSQSQ